MKTIILILLLIQNIYSQQQYDIPWATLGDTPWPIHQRDPQATGRANVIGPQKGLVKWTIDVSKGIEKGPIIWYNDYVVYSDLLGTHNLYFAKNGTIFNQVSLNSLLNTHPLVLKDSSILNWGYPPQTTNVKLYKTLPNLTNIEETQLNFWLDSKSRLIPTLDSCFISSGAEKDSNNVVNYYLYKFNKEGNIIWKRNYPNNINGRVSEYGVSLSPDGKTLYTTGQYNTVIAADVETGNYKWHFSNILIERIPSVDVNGNVYFAGTVNDTTYLYSVFPNGEIRWRYKICTGNLSPIPTPTIDYNGNIYTMIYDNSAAVSGVASVDYWGNERWVYRFERFEYFSTPLLCDSLGNVYGGKTYFGDYTYCAISSQGQLLWELPIKDRKRVLFTGAFGSDGTLYIGTCKSALTFGLTETLMAIIDDTTTSAKKDETIPQSFSLSQNYPNPFNPSTEIRFQIAEDRQVNLIVYDVLGNKAATLINEYKSAGIYKVNFDASNLTSGIYYYSLQAGDFISTKKMILLK